MILHIVGFVSLLFLVSYDIPQYLITHILVPIIIVYKAIKLIENTCRKRINNYEKILKIMICYIVYSKIETFINLIFLYIPFNLLTLLYYFFKLFFIGFIFIYDPNANIFYNYIIITYYKYKKNIDNFIEKINKIKLYKNINRLLL